MPYGKCSPRPGGPPTSPERQQGRELHSLEGAWEKAFSAKFGVLGANMGPGYPVTSGPAHREMSPEVFWKLSWLTRMGMLQRLLGGSLPNQGGAREEGWSCQRDSPWPQGVVGGSFLWPMASKLTKTEVLSSGLRATETRGGAYDSPEHRKCPCFWPRALGEGVGPIIRVVNPELT